MKLDSRIENGKKPLDCFDTEEAESYVGKKCYFSDDIYPFANISDKNYSYQIYEGTLLKVWTDGSDPYETDLQRFYTYCLPCEWVTESKGEKIYRPFTNTKEFFIKTNFEVGDLIHIRSKADNKEYHLMLTGWTTDDELMLGNLQDLSFDELLQKFELWDGEDKFIPFGVEE